MKLAYSGLILLFAALGCQRTAPPEEQPDVAATVNGHPIYSHQIESELLRFEMSEDHGPKRVALTNSVLEKLVLERVLLLEAQKKGITVAQEEVADSLENLARGYRPRDFHEMLHRTYLTPGLLRDRMQERLMIERLVEAQVSKTIAVSDEEMQAYYQKNATRFRIPERVRARQILVRTREQAEQLRERARRGTSFEALARDHSVAPEAKRGGDLGVFGRGVMPPIFDEHCFTLEPNAISNVVASDYGFHLFQVLEKHLEETTSFEEATQVIREELTASKKRQQAASYFDQLREAATITRDLKVLARLAGKEESS